MYFFFVLGKFENSINYSVVLGTPPLSDSLQNIFYLENDNNKNIKVYNVSTYIHTYMHEVEQN